MMRVIHRFLLAVIVVVGVGGMLDIMNFWSRGHHLWETPPPPKTRLEKDTEAKIKCRGYTMATDFVGAKKKLEADKIRVLCTVLNLEEMGIEACDIFSYQWELVVPGWGRRKTGTYLPWLGRHVYVLQRRIGYIETIDPDINETDRNSAILLAERVRKERATLCPSGWKATTIVRPVREHTTGNQRDDELAAIRDPQKMVRQKVEGPSEFEFYYPKE